MYLDSLAGVRHRLNDCTHTEVESLPSGFWGYHHFPRLARQVQTWRRPWFAMTGRFQKQWGDFGGIKPQAALEYEAFRAQALGGGVSVGDQLPPRGVLDPGVYAMIGNVYRQLEAAESFYAGSEPIIQVGILNPHTFGGDKVDNDKSLEGAVQMCEEMHYEAAVVDTSSDFSKFGLLVVPDAAMLDTSTAEKLRDAYQQGVNLVVSHKGAQDPAGTWLLDFLPLELDGLVEKWPTYWRAEEHFAPELSGSDRVCYARGCNVLGLEGTKVLVRRALPYFQRTDLTFCSHFQTPAVEEDSIYPAVIGGERFVYFADPIFKEYRQTGNLAVRDGFRDALRSLYGSPILDGLPTTVLSTLRRFGQDLMVTLLNYIPVRKAIDIDVIEERMTFAGQTLHVRHASPVLNMLAYNGHGYEQVARTEDGGYILPPVNGRLLLKLESYFEAK
jgi:hypothetical protein